MKYYIDGNWQTSNYFWASLQGLANDSQRARLLDGQKLFLGGREYMIVEEQIAEPKKTL